jgi:hypothetical protein
MKKWALLALLFSAAVNIAVVGTLIYFWKESRTSNRLLLMDNDSGLDKLAIFGHDSTSLKNWPEIEKMRQEFHQDMDQLSTDIEKQRQSIIRILLTESPDPDSIDILLSGLVDKQIKAERLTVNHLLDVRPLLPPDHWENLVRSLGKHRIIHINKMISAKDGTQTIIEIKKDSDLTEFH